MKECTQGSDGQDGAQTLEGSKQLGGRATARADHVALLTPRAAVGLASGSGSTVVATGDAVRTGGRPLVEERWFGGLGNKVVSNHLHRELLHLFDGTG